MKLIKQSEIDEAAENYGWRIKTNCFSDPVKTNDLANSASIDFQAGIEFAESKLQGLIIEFAEWIFSKNWIQKRDYDKLKCIHNLSTENNIELSTEQLFEMFINERSNDK